MHLAAVPARLRKAGPDAVIPHNGKGMRYERDRTSETMESSFILSKMRNIQWSPFAYIKSEGFPVWNSIASDVLEETSIGSACSNSLPGWNSCPLRHHMQFVLHSNYKLYQYNYSGRRTSHHRWVEMYVVCWIFVSRTICKMNCPCIVKCVL